MGEGLLWQIVFEDRIHSGAAEFWALPGRAWSTARKSLLGILWFGCKWFHSHLFEESIVFETVNESRHITKYKNLNICSKKIKRKKELLAYRNYPLTRHCVLSLKVQVRIAKKLHYQEIFLQLMLYEKQSLFKNTIPKSRFVHNIYSYSCNLMVSTEASW